MITIRSESVQRCLSHDRVSEPEPLHECLSSGELIPRFVEPENRNIDVVGAENNTEEREDRVT